MTLFSSRALATSPFSKVCISSWIISPFTLLKNDCICKITSNLCVIAAFQTANQKLFDRFFFRITQNEVPQGTQAILLSFFFLYRLKVYISSLLVFYESLDQFCVFEPVCDFFIQFRPAHKIDAMIDQYFYRLINRWNTGIHDHE